MPIPVLKKECPRCRKSFFTYEEQKIFCNTDCESKSRYAEFFNKPDKRQTFFSNCAFCGDEIVTKNRIEKKFCNAHCKREFTNKMSRLSTQKKWVEEKTKPKGQRITYEELDRRAEWRRVFDDHDWMYRTNRNKI